MILSPIHTKEYLCETWRIGGSGGLFHREDGPAIVYEDGTEMYLIRGKKHREDGPAIVRSSGSHSWFKDNEDITEDVLWFFHEQGIEDYRSMTLDQKVIFKLQFFSDQ